MGDKIKWYSVPGMAGMMQTSNGLRIMETTDILSDGLAYQHVSISRVDRLPSWEEIVYVKEYLMGTDTDAVQMIPRRSEYVTLHPFALHIWRKLEGDGRILPP